MGVILLYHMQSNGLLLVNVVVATWEFLLQGG
jgi:hypothetical protein